MDNWKNFLKREFGESKKHVYENLYQMIERYWYLLATYVYLHDTLVTLYYTDITSFGTTTIWRRYFGYWKNEFYDITIPMKNFIWDNWSRERFFSIDAAITGARSGTWTGTRTWIVAGHFRWSNCRWRIKGGLTKAPSGNIFNTNTNFNFKFDSFVLLLVFMSRLLYVPTELVELSSIDVQWTIRTITDVIFMMEMHKYFSDVHLRTSSILSWIQCKFCFVLEI